MHVLIDLTNSPHVPVFAPLVRRLQQRGDTVTITARRFAQTVELASLHGLDVTVIGKHGGTSLLGKARAAISRTIRLRHFVRRVNSQNPIDIALSHGSTDLPLVCQRLDIPHVTIFDYEWAATMHRTNCKRSWKVVTPDMIPPVRLRQYNVGAKLSQYPGLKEEYYLFDHTADPKIRGSLGITDGAPLVVLRPPPELALYHRGAHTDVFDAVLQRLATCPGTTTVILPRTDSQRAALISLLRGVHDASYSEDDAAERVTWPGAIAVIFPKIAVDGLSLVGEADLMISAGGTMNREAVALGVPVYTVFAGRMGAVDEHLIADGRLRLLRSPDDVMLPPSIRSAQDADAPELRDPDELLELLLAGLAPTAAHGRDHG